MKVYAERLLDKSQKNVGTVLIGLGMNILLGLYLVLIKDSPDRIDIALLASVGIIMSVFCVVHAIAIIVSLLIMADEDYFDGLMKETLGEDPAKSSIFMWIVLAVRIVFHPKALVGAVPCVCGRHPRLRVGPPPYIEPITVMVYCPNCPRQFDALVLHRWDTPVGGSIERAKEKMIESWNNRMEKLCQEN